MALEPQAPVRSASAAAPTGWPPPPEGALLDLAEALPHAIALTDTAGLVTWANLGFTRLTGFGPWDTAGRSFTGLVRLGGADAGPSLDVGDALAAGRPYAATVSLYRKDGSLRWADLDLHPLVDGGGVVVAHVAVLTDATEREQTSTRLHHAERLAAIGTLAAGVAHEIASPVQFVGDSVQFLRDAMRDMLSVVAALRAVRRAVTDGRSPRAIAETAARLEVDADLDYLLEHVPRALLSCAEGVDRVTAIVRSLKEFAHPKQSQMAAVDLNEIVSGTLALARHEYKYVAELVTEFGALPPVHCVAGSISQVVLNLVINAAHAVGDAVASSGTKGTITVATRQDGRDVVISVSDTGHGIPEHVRPHIFEPFFTTKAVGKGTGQGLALAWQVVAGTHGGVIEVDSGAGAGATFHVRIPVAGRQSAREVEAAA